MAFSPSPASFAGIKFCGSSQHHTQTHPQNVTGWGRRISVTTGTRAGREGNGEEDEEGVVTMGQQQQLRNHIF